MNEECALFHACEVVSAADCAIAGEDNVGIPTDEERSPMKIICPKCQYSDEIADSAVGESMACLNCGHEIVVERVYISRRELFNNAIVSCPYCGRQYTASIRAENRIVKCSACNQGFLLTTKANTYKSRRVSNQIQSSNVFGQFGRKGNRKLFAALLGVAVILVSAVLYVFRNPIFFDDDVCMAKYVRSMSNGDFAKAMTWAKRIKNETDREIAIKTVETTKKLLTNGR